MNFNLKEITWQDAEKLEPGSKLWVGQTREKAVEGRKSRHQGWATVGGPIALHFATVHALNLTPYIPTTDAVDISPSEAAARMVEGLPVEWTDEEGMHWHSVGPKSPWFISQIADPIYQFRIPACPAKQKLTIEVDAGVEVPDEFTIFPVEQKLSYLVGELATAKVIHREAK